MAISAPAGTSSRIAVETNPADRYGVALARARFAAGTALAGTTTAHVLGVFLSGPTPTRHMMAGRHSQHDSVPGSLCIGPMGADYATEYDGPIDGIILQVSVECLAMVNAGLGCPGGRLVETMNGRDDRLSRIARTMEAEARGGHRNGPLCWSSMVDTLLRHLAERHLSQPAAPLRGMIDGRGLRRLDGFIQDHLAGPIDLAMLAAAAGCDAYHLAHRFRAVVGVSPYRYVMRRRLERARAMLSDARQPIADIAAATGFYDQSHLTNWMRRVYGTTPGRMLAAA